MWLLFIGLAASLVYGLVSAAIVYGIDGRSQAQKFLEMYILSFNILVTLGLMISTALIVGTSQRIIPDTIEAAFTGTPLPEEYYENRRRYFSLRRTIGFASEMMPIGFVIYEFCHFPLRPVGEACLLIAGCAQWGLWTYVGRKIRYAGMMLYSLLDVDVKRNLFRRRELDIINTAVNIAATLTAIFVYFQVRSYYYGPFAYDTFLGRSARVFLLLPAVLAAPVLLMFNFYPRAVLRKIYDKSIEVEIREMYEYLRHETLNPFEKRLRLIELGKMYREELRYSLQLTLTDLPIGLAVLVMIAEPLIRG